MNLLSLLILIVLVIISLGQKKSFFHPSKAYPYFLLIYVIPFAILFLFQGNNSLNHYSLKIIGSESNSLLSYFLLLTSLSLISYNAGVHLTLIKFNPPIHDTHFQNTNNVNKIIKICFFLSITFFLLFYQSMGGILFYLQHLSERSRLALGYNYFSHLYIFFLLFGSCLAILSLKRGHLKKIYFLGLISLSIGLLIISGSRSMIIRYLFILGTCYYFIYQPTKSEIFSFKNKIRMGILLFLISFYVLVVPVIRHSTLSGEINFRESFQEAGGQIADLAKGNMYSEIQLNILKIFDDGDYWWGRSYLDLITAPIPRSILPQKASSDDGLYIFNLVYGTKVELGAPFDKLILNSWPPSTFGIGYASFGPIGVLVWFFILGVLISSFYKLFKKNNSIIFLFLYSYVFWRLHLSNLLLFEVIIVIILSYIFSLFMPKLKKTNIR